MGEFAGGRVNDDGVICMYARDNTAMCITPIYTYLCVYVHIHANVITWVYGRRPDSRRICDYCNFFLSTKINNITS